MLPGEPSWLAVFGPAADPLETRGAQALAFASASSEHALQLDLGAGVSRPAVARGGATTVVLDGIVLDRTLVRAAARDRLAGVSDDGAGFVLAAYTELGEAVLPLLRGAFALVVWDAARGTMLAARDPTDSHPLFFARTRHRVLVASSYGALLARASVPRTLDRRAIAQWVVQGSSLPRRTLYERIERLPPGHVLAAGPDGVRVRRYWHPAKTAPTSELAPSDAVARFDELLDQAVARWSRVGRLAIFLSGGVDSALVAASAASVSRAHASPEPLALSYVYPDPEASEEPTQRAVAQALEIPQLVVPLRDVVGEGGLLATALRLTERSWAPSGYPWEPAFLELAARGARDGCRVVLSGEGGNDWLDAEWFEAADLLRRLEVASLWRLWAAERRAGSRGSGTARALLWTYGGRLFVRDLLLASLSRVAGGAAHAARRRRVVAAWPAWALPDRDLAAALADESIERHSRVRPPSYAADARGRTLDGVHLVVPMENRFLFSRSIGVRFANPAVDPDVVEFLYGLPNSLLNLGGRAKGLGSESARRRLGEHAARLLGVAKLERFLAHVIRAEAPRALRELGGLTRLAELGIVDADAFGRALTGHALGSELGYNQAWQALAGEVWLRRQASDSEERLS